MIVKLKDSFKDDNGGYWQALEVREEQINNNKHSEFLNEISKQVFAIGDINKLKQLLEDEVFYEKIPKWILIKFHEHIQQGEMTVEDFVNEYDRMGHKGFVGVCKILGAL